MPLKPKTTRNIDVDRGFALVAVLFVTAMFFVLAAALLYQGRSEHAIASNEQDHLKALHHAEAGLTWAQRRVVDSANFTALLVGPNPANAGDDNLLGLRSLGLTATSQFVNGNEATASAIVNRDFGDGSKRYEAVRINDGTNARALVYVRIDDNHDDDATDPSNDDPLADKDNRAVVTVVAEYPVFVDGGGTERQNPNQRGRAQRMLRATFGGDVAGTAAIATNGDLDIPENMRVCGDCGSVHANQDLSIGGGPSICQDATASGNFSGNTGGVGGAHGGGFPVLEIPIINPYDDIFVPEPDVFQVASPVVCPAGTAKYFALVADDDKGLVFKAYWSSGSNRWNWKLIDDLSDGSDVRLDDCGRAPGDAGYPAAAGRVNDGLNDQFYGWKAASTEQSENCSSCGSGNGDASLCAIGNNDFAKKKYYDTGGVLQTTVSGSNIPAFPGSFEPDTLEDYNPGARVKDGKWDFSSSTVYSPLYGAVIWVYGNVMISGNPGDSSSIDFDCSTTAGCSSNVSMPHGLWKVSIISYGDISISGQANIGPANPSKDYHFLAIAGRDIMINGNPQEDTAACGSNCSTSAPADIADIAGIYAAHEQIQISGSPNIFGFLMAEDAIDCSSTVDGQGSGVSTVNGDPHIFYDCQHPPNPWATGGDVTMLSWEERQ